MMSSEMSVSGVADRPILHVQNENRRQRCPAIFGEMALVEVVTAKDALSAAPLRGAPADERCSGTLRRSGQVVQYTAGR